MKHIKKFNESFMDNLVGAAVKVKNRLQKNKYNAPKEPNSEYRMALARKSRDEKVMDIRNKIADYTMSLNEFEEIKNKIVNLEISRANTYVGVKGSESGDWHRTSYKRTKVLLKDGTNVEFYGFHLNSYGPRFGIMGYAIKCSKFNNAKFVPEIEDLIHSDEDVLPELRSQSTEVLPGFRGLDFLRKHSDILLIDKASFNEIVESVKEFLSKKDDEFKKSKDYYKLD